MNVRAIILRERAGGKMNVRAIILRERAGGNGQSRQNKPFGLQACKNTIWKGWLDR